MWIELGTMVLTTLLSLAGVGAPQLDTDVIAAAPDGCQLYEADGCLNQDACDVFISEAGTEVCGLACDLRTTDACEADGLCAVIDGVCDYPDHSPVGC